MSPNSKIESWIFQPALLLLAVLATTNASSENCWKSLTSIKNGPRQEHGVATVGSLIYVVGGTKMNGRIRGQVSTVEVYDIKSNSWSDGPPLPVEIHHPNVVAVNGKVYVLGGLDGFVPTRKTLGNIWRLDPIVNQWEELPPMPNGTERGSSAVGVKGSVIYLAGGLQPQPGDLDFGARVTDMSSAYDTVSGMWTTLPKLPEKRDHGGGAFVGDTFYVIGGRIGAIQSFSNTVFALEPNAKEWSPLAKMPTGRGGLAVAGVGSKIYAFGGEGNLAPGSKAVFPQCEVYDATTNTWQKEPDMKVPRHGTQAVVIEKMIFIPGGGISGGGGSSVATMEAYGAENC
jgi:N-acetylneuraminic acid mutarotase